MQPNAGLNFGVGDQSRTWRMVIHGRSVCRYYDDVLMLHLYALACDFVFLYFHAPIPSRTTDA